MTLLYSLILVSLLLPFTVIQPNDRSQLLDNADKQQVSNEVSKD